MTWTVSPFLMRSFAISEHLRSQRNDLHELLFAELTADGPEDAGPARVAVAAQDDCRVLVEADVRTVGAAALLDGADDDRLDDVALLDVAAGDRVLDGGDDDVADTGVAAARTTEHADAEDLLRTRVVGDPKSRLLLDHFSFPSSRRFSVEPGGTRCGRCPAGSPAYLARSRISTTRHRFVAESGRVSLMRTRSPTPATLPSSCALTLLERRRTLP